MTSTSLPHRLLLKVILVFSHVAMYVTTWWGWVVPFWPKMSSNVVTCHQKSCFMSFGGGKRLLRWLVTMTFCDTIWHMSVICHHSFVGDTWILPTKGGADLFLLLHLWPLQPWVFVLIIWLAVKPFWLRFGADFAPILPKTYPQHLKWTRIPNHIPSTSNGLLFFLHGIHTNMIESWCRSFSGCDLAGCGAIMAEILGQILVRYCQGNTHSILSEPEFLSTIHPHQMDFCLSCMASLQTSSDGVEAFLEVIWLAVKPFWLRFGADFALILPKY